MSIIADIQDDIENLSAYLDDVEGSVSEAKSAAHYAVTEASNAQTALTRVSDKLASMEDNDDQRARDEAVLHLQHAASLLLR